jgi:hypothetical protein
MCVFDEVTEPGITLDSDGLVKGEWFANELEQLMDAGDRWAARPDPD